MKRLFHSTPNRAQSVDYRQYFMDMPFLFHPLRDIVPYGAAHSTLGNEVNRAAKYTNLGVGGDPIPQKVLFIRSDHFNFVKNGIPTLFNKSSFETGSDLDGKEVNLNWRSTRYHRLQDDMNQDFDFEAGADHGRFNLLVGYYVAQNSDRPQWNKRDFFWRKVRYYGKKIR